MFLTLLEIQPYIDEIDASDHESDVGILCISQANHKSGYNSKHAPLVLGLFLFQFTLSRFPIRRAS